MAGESHGSTALPAWPVRLMAELDASDQRARDLVDGLTLELLNRPPTAGAWSVGQCLEHLCVANEVYLPAISDSLTGKPVSPVEEIMPGWFGRWFIRNYIEPSPQSTRATAPKKITPGARVEASVLERFLRGNQALRKLVCQAGEYDVNRVRFRNPFVPLIRFTAGTGLQILTRHQVRHLLQAERAKQAIKGS
jgi:hypothetical protein